MMAGDPAQFFSNQWNQAVQGRVVTLSPTGQQPGDFPCLLHPRPRLLGTHHSKKTLPFMVSGARHFRLE
jgi:hypothetical protein